MARPEHRCPATGEVAEQPPGPRLPPPGRCTRRPLPVTSSLPFLTIFPWRPLPLPGCKEIN